MPPNDLAAALVASRKRERVRSDKVRWRAIGQRTRSGSAESRSGEQERLHVLDAPLRCGARRSFWRHRVRSCQDFGADDAVCCSNHRFRSMICVVQLMALVARTCEPCSFSAGARRETRRRWCDGVATDAHSPCFVAVVMSCFSLPYLTDEAGFTHAGHAPAMIEVPSPRRGWLHIPERELGSAYVIII